MTNTNRIWHLKQWCKDNPEKVNAKSKRWRDRNPEYFLFYMAKRRAKEDGIEFSITMEDIPDVPETCPILDIPLYKRTDGKRGPCDNSPTLDRVNPLKGYVIDNLQIISYKANRWKSNMTKADLQLLIDYINEHEKMIKNNNLII